MKKDRLKIVQDTAEELLKLLKMEAKVKTVEDKENEAVKVQIETEDPGVLIGHYGETLNAFQLILGLIINKKLGVWQRIIVNVGDYREKQEGQLKNLALNTAQKVKFSGEPAVIPNLTSFERRIIHLLLADHPDVTTESEGEENYRRLVVKPKIK